MVLDRLRVFLGTVFLIALFSPFIHQAKGTRSLGQFTTSATSSWNVRALFVTLDKLDIVDDALVTNSHFLSPEVFDIGADR